MKPRGGVSRANRVKRRKTDETPCFQLRNTDWILGLVLATGTETKVAFRKEAPAGGEAKETHTNALINVDVAFLVVVLIVICIAGATVHAAFQIGYGHGEETLWYLGGADAEFSIGATWVITVFTYFLLSSCFIPIVFYVFRNMILLLSKSFVQSDLQMYDAEGDEPCQVRSRHRHGI